MSGRQAKIILKAVEYLARLRKYDPTLISGGDWRDWFMQSAWRSQRDLLTNEQKLASYRALASRLTEPPKISEGQFLREAA